MTQDLHRKRASKIFCVPVDKVTPEQRQYAKMRSFYEHYSPPINERIKAMSDDRSDNTSNIEPYRLYEGEFEQLRIRLEEQIQWIRQQAEDLIQPLQNQLDALNLLWASAKGVSTKVSNVFAPTIQTVCITAPAATNQPQPDNPLEVAVRKLTMNGRLPKRELP